MSLNLFTNYYSRVQGLSYKTQKHKLVVMSQSSAERCSQLKSVFEQLESFEIIGIRQTKYADEIVLSWNGSTKLNANTIRSDIQKFIIKSRLKLPNNKSWTKVSWPPYEKLSTNNKIVWHPKKTSKK
eukprot:167775_1